MMKFLTLFLTLPLSLSLSLFATPLAAQPVVAGYVTQLRSEVTLEAPSGRQALALGSALNIGSRILTGANARLEARMRDGTVLTLGERTEFVIEQVASATGQGQSTTFSLLKGAFRALTGPDAAKPGQTWQVRTPVAIIGVRGTELWGGFNLLGAGEDTLDVAMFSGKGVYVENSAGKTELRLSGEGTTVSRVGAVPGPVVKWGDMKINAAIRSVGW